MQQTLWLYGVIEDGDVGAKFVRNELRAADSRYRILVRLNTPGGSVHEAIAIHTQLSEWPAGVDVQVDGIAASAGSYIATVGRNVVMARDAMLMLHDAWTVTAGNAAEHQSAATMLDQISQTLVQAYAAKSGKSAAEIRRVMKAETWFTAAGAVEFGLADSILGERSAEKIAALQARLDALTA